MSKHLLHLNEEESKCSDYDDWYVVRQKNMTTRMHGLIALWSSARNSIKGTRGLQLHWVSLSIILYTITQCNVKCWLLQIQLYTMLAGSLSGDAVMPIWYIATHTTRELHIYADSMKWL